MRTKYYPEEKNWISSDQIGCEEDDDTFNGGGDDDDDAYDNDDDDSRAHVHGLTGWRKLCRKRIAARGNLPPGAARQKSKLDGEGLI